MIPERMQRVTIAASGDALLHIRVNLAAEAEGWEHVFQGFAESRHADDLGFVNLETPLVQDVNDPLSAATPILGAAPAAAAGLKAVGVHVLGCANNHAYDQDSVGLQRTLQGLEAEGLVAVGAGPDESAAFAHRIVIRDGLRVAFLSVTYTLNRGPGEQPPLATVARFRDPEPVTNAIRAARADVDAGRADIVVLGVHWSGDYRRRIMPNQRRWAAEWVEAGADLILGTGPHILHPVEVVDSPRGRAVVAYSLGNFVSNQGNLYRVGHRSTGSPARHLSGTRDAVLLRVEFRMMMGQLRVHAVEGVPMWTTNNFLEFRRGRAPTMDIAVRRLRELDEATRVERRARIAAALGPAVTLVD